MKYLTVFALAALLGPLGAGRAVASDIGYLYGTITTSDGTAYTGELRWGKEEAFWDDVFNSDKRDNPYLKYLDSGDLDDLEQEDHTWWDRAFHKWHRDYEHSFAVRFGDLRSIEILSHKRVQVTFKDGSTYELEDGSNDIGAKITVVDDEIGTVRVKWDRIERIDFTETPSRLQNKIGEPLYGAVDTRHGTFTGFIQWDHQECLTVDELDGESRDGDMSIEFGDIRSIERTRHGSMVKLKSGREFELRGTNDVDDDNRGVIVKSPELGKVKVGWEDFDKVTFDDVPGGAVQGYNDYRSPRELAGRVTTHRGDVFSGRIVYDLDEGWDFEMLNGRQDDTEFVIPFREISRIEPDGRKGAIVELRSGRTLRLEKTQDVSYDHDGLLVFGDGRDPRYIRWRDVEEIRLD